MRNNLINIFALILILLGGCLVLPLVVAVFYREDASIIAFAITMLLCIIPGLGMRFIFKSDLHDSRVKIRDTYMIVAATWLLSSVIGCLPYIISGSIPDFFEAFFESVSGFTTTGASIIDDVEIMPRSILLWRSFTQWLGGMGIIVLFVALLPSLGIKARNIAKAETPGISVTRLTYRYTGTAQRLYVLYFALTFLLVILLALSGVSIFDSVNHAFTTMATGGFSTYNASIGYFDSKLISWIIIIFMLIAGTNFELFFMFFTSNRKRAFANEELRLYVFLVVVSSLVISGFLMLRSGYSNFVDAITDASFQVVTIITTTGYAIANHDLWPAFCQILLIILMFTGACSSSTAGGFKLIRIKALFRMYIREVKVKLHGNIIRDVSMDGRKLTSENITYLVGFLASYFITLILCMLLVSISNGGDFVTNFSACLSCVGNNGAGFGNIAPGYNFGLFNGFSKTILSLAMIAGRLEISTLFILFSKSFWRPHSV